ncbi:uncharacterized protein LOC135583148 isoform X6 [Musa acuminata AAA Group]|uniref:uncharacterized protein LOC135583148 isoform X6 n=1 Tax=Musa acuminata AAA Group TaxID=214697 RepID=UPI0031DACE0A
MAALMCPSSPNSLRLQFGFRCRESSAVFLRVRFRPTNRRVVVSFAGGEAARSGGGGRPWNGSDGSPDGFAGWLETGTGAGQSKKKGGLREMLGAWLAGVLFAAGVTFATLSIVNKNASGAKQQVEPLAREQEILMSSVDASEKDNRVGEVSNVVTIGEESIISDRNEDNETGTSENFTPTNVNGDVSESRYGDMQDLESSLSENIKSVGEGVIEIKRALTLDEQEVAQNVDNLPLFAGLSNSTHELPTYEDGFSYETSKSDDLGCTTTFDTLESAQQVPPGKILVPAFVDQVQGHALAALQVLKVIEVDAQPGDLCTRREYARWLVTASNVFSRNTFSKVYPAMYIENLTELAFDDVTPKDPDFPFIQGLAEAGLISSKLSRSDLDVSVNILDDYVLFSPDSPLSRQDLISWKMALERRQLPEVDKNHLYQCTGYIDVDKINPDAWPALIADFAGGEQGITALAFGYTRLFQPDKPVTKAQAAIAIATGDAAEVVGEELARIEAESLAETAVNAHTTLVAQVEKDLNASFEEELAKERQKTKDLEKLAEEARLELNRLRTQREEEKNALITSHATVESEMEVLSRLRHEVEEQLQNLMSNKLEISFERDRMNKLRKEVESENQVIIRLQYELEVERKALIMARSWAEEEAKRAREQAKALEEARERWERHGIKIVVDGDLQDDASIGTTWLIAGDQPPVDETIGRGETLVKKLKEMAAEMKHRSSVTIEKIIQRIVMIISALKQWVSVASNHATELRIAGISKAKNAMIEFKESASGFSLVIVDKARRVVADCKGSVGKISQKFKA